MASPSPQFLPVLPPQFEGEPGLQVRHTRKAGTGGQGCFVKAASLLVPSLRDPGQEKMGEVGYMVRAGHRDKLQRIQNMQVNGVPGVYRVHGVRGVYEVPGLDGVHVVHGGHGGHGEH